MVNTLYLNKEQSGESVEDVYIIIHYIVEYSWVQNSYFSNLIHWYFSVAFRGDLFAVQKPYWWTILIFLDFKSKTTTVNKNVAPGGLLIGIRSAFLFKVLRWDSSLEATETSIRTCYITIVRLNLPLSCFQPPRIMLAILSLSGVFMKKVFQAPFKPEDIKDDLAPAPWTHH